MAQPFVVKYRSLAAGGPLRPYLFLVLTGLNARSGPVPGIVDSGADSTSLPFGYASLMGYSTETLEARPFTQVGGASAGYTALQPCTGFVPEIADVVIEMRPMFIEGAQVALWGRQDFMSRFDVTFRERQQEFIITPVA